MKEKNEVTKDKQTEPKIEEKELKSEERIKIKNGKVVFALKIPIKFNEEDIKDITLDFNSLKGIDICDAESQALSEFYTPLPDTNYSTAYQAAIAAKAAGLPFEVILELKSKDFKMVTECTKGFLLG